MKKTEKRQKNLKGIILILFVILLVLVSVIGIYVKKNGSYENIVKGYSFGMEMQGNRILVLNPDNSSESVTKDADGKVVENATDEDKAKEGYTTEDVPVNNEEVLTEENFKKSKEIIEKRIEDYRFEGYTIRTDSENGEIYIELAENKNTDKLVGLINKQGKFEIKDSESNEVLLDNSAIKDAKVMYNNTQNGTSVILDIEFNKEGKEKLKQISEDYKTIEKKEDSEKDNEATENEESEEEATTSSEENKEEKEEEKQKEIVMEINGEKIMTTSFDDPITDGRLPLTVGQASKDVSKIQDNIEQGRTTATLLSSGNMPIKYKIESNKYIKKEIPDKIVKTVLISVFAFVVGITIFFILKFKLKGLISATLAIGYIAITLLIVRYANVKISIDGIMALFILTIINYIFTYSIVKNSNKEDDERVKITKIFIKNILAIVPIFIISIVFTYASPILLSSFGMVLFWGTVLTILYNFIFANVFFKKEN